MQDAAKILVVGGLFNLAYSVVTGAALGAVRAKQPEASKYLRLAHQGPLMWAPILFGLVVVLPFCQMSDAMKTTAAALMVISSALLNTKDTWHWLRETKDEFAEKPPALYLGHAMTLAFVISLGLFSYGVIVGLL